MTEGTEPRDQLTPSEIVLLLGERFAKRQRVVGEPLMLAIVGAVFVVVGSSLLYGIANAVANARQFETGALIGGFLALLAGAAACVLAYVSFTRS